MALRRCCLPDVPASDSEGTEVNNDNSAENQDGEDQKVVVDGDMLAFSLPTADGAEINIEEVVKANRITVIDFWASWCGPCRQEMPNMVKLHNSYADKGLAIVGISLDDDYDSWTAACKELGVEWYSVIDTEGIAEKFGIEYIPYTMIFNAQGQLLNQNLRGEELNEFIAEQLQ